MTIGLEKAPTGIAGLDEITGGGLPRGRPTLACGTAGCGKTLLAMQFIVLGAVDHDEPGVFVSFEETAEELADNVSSLGWDLAALEKDGRIVVDHVSVRGEYIAETGAYDLEGLFIRLGAAIDSIGAKRVAIDTLEVLFAALDDTATLRSEIRRLFAWLKERDITAVVTAERGNGSLTRHGLEEYVSDCVILLDHRVSEQVSTRRLRVVKYRGTSHSADEAPFMIDHRGFRVMPVTSLRLEHVASTERISSGVARLDTMLGGDGYFRGGSVLISGNSGSGKTTLASSFLAAGCRRGERGLLVSFEESPSQLLRNMRSVGLDLEPFVRSGLLHINSTRPTSYGLEAHLVSVVHALEDFQPSLVVVDPMSALTGETPTRLSTLVRLIDVLKTAGVTAVFTALVDDGIASSAAGVSSLIDAWLALATVESNGERNRSITIVKARGTGHSNQVREFVITPAGIEITDVYTGSGQVLMGTARRAAEARELEEQTRSAASLAARRRAMERRKAAVEAEIAALRAGLDSELEAFELDLRDQARARSDEEATARRLASARFADEEVTS
ncbi:MAG TPA: circadian clock protein KaiC [Acidimicrobiales bacterium]|nr:circadian clock protein KaiC [Acidimicrobiales bacterium]